MTLCLTLALGTAEAKKVKFSHLEVAPGDTIAHTYRYGSNVAEDQEKVLARIDQTFEFSIPLDGQALGVSIVGSLSSTEVDTPPHPLDGKAYKVDITEGGFVFTPTVAPREEEVLSDAIIRMVSLTDFGAALHGQKLVVGEPLEDALLDGEIRRFFGLGDHDVLGLTLTGVEKVAGRKLALFDVTMDNEHEPNLSGSLRVDPSTARLVELDLVGEADEVAPGMSVVSVYYESIVYQLPSAR